MTFDLYHFVLPRNAKVSVDCAGRDPILGGRVRSNLYRRSPRLHDADAFNFEEDRRGGAARRGVEPTHLHGPHSSRTARARLRPTRLGYERSAGQCTRRAGEARGRRGRPDTLTSRRPMHPASELNHRTCGLGWLARRVAAACARGGEAWSRCPFPFARQGRGCPGTARRPGAGWGPRGGFASLCPLRVRATEPGGLYPEGARAATVGPRISSICPIKVGHDSPQKGPRVGTRGSIPGTQRARFKGTPRRGSGGAKT